MLGHRRRPKNTGCPQGPTLVVSRPARRSHVLRPVGSPSRHATRLSRRLRRFRYLHRRSDSYRLERPSCRVGIAPTEDQHLTRFTAHRYAVPGTPGAPDKFMPIGEAHCTTWDEKELAV